MGIDNIITYGEARKLREIIDDLSEQKDVITDLIYFAGRKGMIDFLSDNISPDHDGLDQKIETWIDILKGKS